MKSNKIHRRLRVFLRELYLQKHCKLRLKGTEDYKTKRPLVPQILMGRNQTEKANTAANRGYFGKKWKNDI